MTEIDAVVDQYLSENSLRWKKDKYGRFVAKKNGCNIIVLGGPAMGGYGPDYYKWLIFDKGKEIKTGNELVKGKEKTDELAKVAAETALDKIKR